MKMMKTLKKTLRKALKTKPDPSGSFFTRVRHRAFVSAGQGEKARGAYQCPVPLFRAPPFSCAAVRVQESAFSTAQATRSPDPPIGCVV